MHLRDLSTNSPALHPILIDMAAQALESAGHTSPVGLQSILLAAAQTITLEWSPPDTRIISTYQPPDITEQAAIGIAAVILPANLRIVKVIPRLVRVPGQRRPVGTRVDYFLGDQTAKLPTVTGVLEVGGLASGSLSTLLSSKAAQASTSPYTGVFTLYAFGCVFGAPEAELRKV